MTTTTVRFDDSIDELEADIEELTEQLDGLSSDNPVYERLRGRQQRLTIQRKGAIWARDQAHEAEDIPAWDAPTEAITFETVAAGAYQRVVQDATSTDGQAAASVRLVAAATAEAPYVDGDMGRRERVAAVADLHPYFLEWAEARVTELLDPEGNVTGSGGS